MATQPLASTQPIVSKFGHKTLSSAANLANLLPTGSLILFQAISPIFSNNGDCNTANKALTASVIAFFSLVCFLSCFTDSFIGRDEKLYYGLATKNGFYIFNDDPRDEYDPQDDINDVIVKKKYRVTWIDYVHAFTSLIVFLVFAFTSSDVETCLFRNPGASVNTLVINLPIGVGMVASFLFSIFPTQRRGIGYGDMSPRTQDV